ncbi:MAG TPA: hypothetical protein VJQ06_01920 [Rhizomicrobium sp.]|nr:hypothetical protein [Rhizomicrobium sp.]
MVKVIALLGLINFLTFVAGTFYLGGDALNGYRQGDRYFLGMHGNGPFAEVSRGIFLYSEWHAFVVIGTVVFVLGAEVLFRLKGSQP